MKKKSRRDNVCITRFPRKEEACLLADWLTGWLATGTSEASKEVIADERPPGNSQVTTISKASPHLHSARIVLHSKRRLTVSRISLQQKRDYGSAPAGSLWSLIGARRNT